MGYNSAQVSFGEVLDSRIKLVDEASDLKNRKKSTFKKRRTVRWLKTVARDHLDPMLYRLLNTHNAIVEATHQYGEYIDRTLLDFYVKGGYAYLVLDVRQHEKIRALGLSTFIVDLIKDATDFIQYSGMEIEQSDVFTKISVNSAGKLELFGKSAPYITILGILVIAINGGGIKVESIGLDISTPGLIRNLNDFYNSEEDRKLKREIMYRHMEELKLQSPEDLVRVLDEINEKDVDLKRIEEQNQTKSVPKEDTNKEEKDE